MENKNLSETKSDDSKSFLTEREKSDLLKNIANGVDVSVQLGRLPIECLRSIYSKNNRNLLEVAFGSENEPVALCLLQRGFNFKDLVNVQNRDFAKKIFQNACDRYALFEEAFKSDSEIEEYVIVPSTPINSPRVR